MIERLSGIQITFDPDEDIIFGIVEPGKRAILVDQELINQQLMQLETTYREVALQTGNITQLICPAGGSDIYPLLLMSSVDKLTIIDPGTFLSPEAAGINIHSMIINAILAENQGKYINLDTIQDDPRFTHKQNESFSSCISTAAKIFARNQLIDGFQERHVENPQEKEYDNFIRILGGLLINRVDLHTLQFGFFGEDEYRMKFFVGDKEKMIIYKNESIDKNFSWRESNYTDSRLAVIAKADNERITHFAVREIKPDVVIAQNHSNSHSNISTLGMYLFRPIHNPSFPDLKWGYGTVRDIQIGTKPPGIRRIR